MPTPNRFLVLAKKAPPAGTRPTRKALYDEMLPGVIALHDDKGYTVKAAVELLLTRSAWKGTARERSNAYRSLCQRMAKHAAEMKAVAERRMGGDFSPEGADCRSPKAQRGKGAEV